MGCSWRAFALRCEACTAPAPAWAGAGARSSSTELPAPSRPLSQLTTERARAPLSCLHSAGPCGDRRRCATPPQCQDGSGSCLLRPQECPRYHSGAQLLPCAEYFQARATKLQRRRTTNHVFCVTHALDALWRVRSGSPQAALRRRESLRVSRHVSYSRFVLASGFLMRTSPSSRTKRRSGAFGHSFPGRLRPGTLATHLHTALIEERPGDANGGPGDLPGDLAALEPSPPC